MKPRNILLILATLILALALSLVAQAEPPAPSTADVTLAGTVASKISYQGRLTDAGGNPLNGTYNLVFQLWDDATAGSQVGVNIVRNGVPVSNGLFTVDLDVPQSAFNGQALWLRIQVGGQWLSPRQELLPVPYALGLRPGARIDGNTTGAVVTVTNQAMGAKGVAGIAENYSGIGVYGSGGFGVGVQGNGEMGVKGIGSVGPGIWGEGATGVYGKSANGYGVWGSTDAPMTVTVAGVYGSGDNAIGVMGTSLNKVGGYFTSTHGTGASVQTLEGYGLYVQSGDNIGIYAHSGRWIYPILRFGHIGVFGNAEEGTGVIGLGGPTGGYFSGYQGVQASGIMTGVTGTADNMGGRGVVGIADNYSGIGVYGSGGFGIGVQGNGEIGVKGVGSVGAGVWGEGATGVYGASQNGPGVWGDSTSGHGVYAYSQGVGVNGTALYAENPNTNHGMAAYILNNSDYHTAHFYNAGTGGVLYLQNGGTDASGTGGGDFITAVNKPRNDVQFRVTTNGAAYSDNTFYSWGADLAEMVPAVKGLEPGDVLVIGPDGTLILSSEPYQASVAGVYSTQPGFVGGQPVTGEVAGNIPLAVVGVVPVKVSAENGAIRPGDLLVSSSTPGYAMKAGPNPPQGTVIGKALGKLEAGTGIIKMLATLQ
jgi:hypothetical protein